MYKTKKQKMKFYKSSKWMKLRNKRLAHDNFECQLCKAKGLYNEGKNVHHIKEIEYYPKQALEFDNLQTLCIKCHNEVHGRSWKQMNLSKRKVWNDERW